MSNSFFSSNSAFQRFSLPLKQVQKIQIFVESDLLQNHPHSSKQIEVNKILSIPIYNLKEQSIDEQNFHDISSEENAKEDISSIAKTLDDHRSADLKKKRKTKKEIACNEKDEGRGGNCIASNITKTLLRIIKIKVNNTLWNQFKSFTERYKVKSQKQNTIILLLILYVFVKQGKLQVTFFEDILGDHFFKSLGESRSNCEKKMESQPQRRFFHLKNRKMYNKFIEINTKLFESLKVALEAKTTQILKLDQIEEIISDTYDRKQRQVEKAINKIKSIILNHTQLKELFGYQESDVFQTFYDSVEYAYRRNLPKRSKQTILKATKFIDEFKELHNLECMKERYFVCFLATKLIGEKERQIWDEFIEIFNMKKQFNTTQFEIQEMNQYLRIEIPQQVCILEQLQTKRSLQQDDECKQQNSDTQQHKINKINSLYRTYLELSNNKIPY